MISTEDKKWVDGALSQIAVKMETVAERNAGKIPYTTDENGRFDDRSSDKDICWWTNGFWGGEMWQLYKLTGKELFRNEAIGTENKMDRAFMNYNGMDHDAGFRWLPTSVVRYKMEHNEESKNRGLLAAASLAGRFNLNGNFIRAWNDWGDDRDTTGWAIIDCMMNLPLLYWASNELKDPRFKAIAVAHADTAMKSFIREDGSVRHIVGFDPESGAFLRDYAGQGYAEGSSWTRGQSWALYGFVLSYKYTGEKRYLETAMKVADYVLSELDSKFPEYLVPVDYRQPADPYYEDSTASAITASGLIELAGLLGGLEEAGEENVYKEKADIYQAAAIKLLKTLHEKRCDYTTDKDNIVEKCTAAYHDARHEFAINYGDYYYIEALMKLSGDALEIF
ncbi:glycoside hydrolase family 88 protein [Butyrivibrio sp. INlla14]|uniref:glycoside hydrolase family 88 protein n=1 Tax=Butyrivibrio sp. INlla14 TaxID=1520808 RepID=UPI00087651A7|nr:glycoside hydrolase family 88 protein [Butyrivibrio sp. INlla14]SCY69894.1 unsaturated chondroitin disaccharide hydrolase [Butyrivibrio sp. INlla14]